MKVHIVEFHNYRQNQITDSVCYMNYRDALNTTFERFNVRASEVAAKSGVDESRLSKFRRGKHDMSSEALQSVVDALPESARAYYYLLVIQDGRSKGGEVA